ncbi:MAG TPA: hypothetical protein VIE43_24895 [Thermoanaerobaculia bacterium]|jgi:hypothetical protein|nr:hypothetical protein [Thermoanaerobaculia bacterium]
MPEENPPNPPQPKPPGMLSDFSFKEIITAVIALAIVASLITMLWIAFVQAGKITDDQKYIIAIILSLAGTVTGYYFGRVPAEKRADTAEWAADSAKKEKVQADAKVEDVKKTLDRLSIVRAVGYAEGEASGTQQELAALRRRL